MGAEETVSGEVSLPMASFQTLQVTLPPSSLGATGHWSVDLVSSSTVLQLLPL